ncbi:MAG: S9 family peptidase [Candidatus Dormibacteria bacterium]
MGQRRQRAPGYEGAWEFFRRVLEPGLDLPLAATDFQVAPDGRRALWTAETRHQLAGRAGSRIYLTDLDNRGTRPLIVDPLPAQYGGRWSPAGDRVGFIATLHSGQPALHVVDPNPPSRSYEVLALSGFMPEALEWAADGTILVLAAEEGAEMGVTAGSGQLPAAGDEEAEPWWPEVRSGGLGGWRTVFAVTPGGGNIRRLLPEGINVWEFGVAGELLLAVVSDRPTEGDWTHSRLELLNLQSGERRVVHRPRRQLRSPVISPDGSRLAVVEGLASDRGIVYGDILEFPTSGGPGRVLPCAGTDVSYLRFRDRSHLLATGVRRQETVVAELDLDRGAVAIHLQDVVTTSGRFTPDAAPHPEGGALLALESWGSPPILARAELGRASEIASLSHPGFEWLRGQIGTVREVSWSAPDGLEISGLLVEPRQGSRPYPTILAVHGGPVGRWESEWPGRDRLHYAYLSARGFALFMPNPRGSCGRGQDFLEVEVGDYGGAEVQDHLSGLDHLVAEGVADPRRLGVLGVSHGGYMACWITTRTDRFAAAVAGSPVTDWYSQHFASNIPEFDAQFLGADGPGPGGPYFERSPVFFAGRSRTPTLLTAGQLDRCTPPGQAVEFHEALLASGVETELALYPEEGHGVRDALALADFAARSCAWFDRWMG